MAAAILAQQSEGRPVTDQMQNVQLCQPHVIALATGRPMLAGVSGHAAEFLGQHLPDVKVFGPLDTSAMVAAVNRLIDIDGQASRTLFCENFARRNIMKRMAADVLELLKQ